MDLKIGIYRHYKGPLYMLQGVARHSETGEHLAVYVPLYHHDGPGMAVRPLAMFCEDVEVNGQRQPRFAYVGQVMPAVGEVAKVTNEVLALPSASPALASQRDDWAEAEKNLRTCIAQYESLRSMPRVNVELVLVMQRGFLRRFENGERTPELLKEMLDAE